MATIEEQLIAKIQQISTASTPSSITPALVGETLDLARQLVDDSQEILLDDDNDEYNDF